MEERAGSWGCCQCVAKQKAERGYSGPSRMARRVESIRSSHSSMRNSQRCFCSEYEHTVGRTSLSFSLLANEYCIFPRQNPAMYQTFTPPLPYLPTYGVPTYLPTLPTLPYLPTLPTLPNYLPNLPTLPTYPTYPTYLPYLPTYLPPYLPYLPYTKISHKRPRPTNSV